MDPLIDRLQNDLQELRDRVTIIEARILPEPAAPVTSTAATAGPITNDPAHVVTVQVCKPDCRCIKHQQPEQVAIADISIGWSAGRRN